ncbi:MAG: alpha/beta hydrolase [Armatimonadota bacterium]
MSLLHIGYHSQSLGKQSGMFVAMPDIEPPFRTVYLLHGLSDDYTIWQRRTSIERYADRFGLLVVMPDGGRGFYCDLSYGKYEGHILETVRFIDRTFRTADAPEGRGIGGLSMGGYGAIKFGLKYPELFGSVAAHSSALDINRLQTTDLVQGIFPAPPDPEDDPFVLAARTGAKPAIRLDCGVDDSLIEDNRRFHAHLQALEIPHTYEEYPGAHTWEYWDEHIVDALAFHAEQMTGVRSS